jgi:hypothetical protein
MNKIKTYKTRKALEAGELGIEMVEMKYSDIERSPIVSKILEIFNNKNVIDNDLQIPTQPLLLSPTPTPIFNNNTSANNSIVQIKKYDNDAALIPLSDMSGRFNSPDKTNLVF